MNQFPSIRKLDQAILYSLELASSLSVLLLASTSVAEEHSRTPQLPKEATAKEEQKTPPVALFPSVSEEEKDKVIEAYTNGISRREICSYLHWGSAKYTTIVKPVLDTYERREQQEEHTEEQR